MPPPVILDPATVDCSRVVYSREQIYERLPQRHEFAQLDAIVHLDRENDVAVGYRDVRPSEWWCRGHLPGMPVFPGVLMIESAAHMAAFYRSVLIPGDGFMGFGAVDSARFRDAVQPPARVILVGRLVEIRHRRFVYDVQSFVGGVMVFEVRITGMPVQL